MDFKELINTPDITYQFDPADVEANKVWGGIAYILFFIPLIGCPDSAFGKFHANQGLTLLIAAFILSIVSGVVSYIPLVGGILCWVIRVIIAAYTILGLVTGLQGKAKELPLIGSLFSIIK